MKEQENAEDRDTAREGAQEGFKPTEHGSSREPKCPGCGTSSGGGAGTRIVGVIIEGDGSVCYFNTSGVELCVGDVCAVETEKGSMVGRVAVGPMVLAEGCPRELHGRVIRKALPVDFERHKRLQGRKQRAMKTCREKIAARGLVMKLVNVEFVEHANKVIFYFTADGRVDFRELVKDLAAQFRKRIEMRQIGVRDEARMVGGLGSCGRHLCCATFLRTLEPISIRMAKDQELTLNPTRISGLCGRLLCCLAYEHDHYKELRRRVPATGKMVKAPRGVGKVVKVNLLLERVTVQFDDDQQVEYPANEVEPVRR